MPKPLPQVRVRIPKPTASEPPSRSGARIASPPIRHREGSAGSQTGQRSRPRLDPPLEQIRAAGFVATMPLTPPPERHPRRLSTARIKRAPGRNFVNSTQRAAPQLSSFGAPARARPDSTLRRCFDAPAETRRRALAQMLRRELLALRSRFEPPTSVARPCVVSPCLAIQGLRSFVAAGVPTS